MIRYDLRCVAGHGFDGWFRSSDDFDRQAGGGQLACPSCGSAMVEKALMAPAVSTRKASAVIGDPVKIEATAVTEPPAGESVALLDAQGAKLRQMMREFRAELTRNSEDVGERFPEVARRMHSEEIEHRTIHGRATAEEAKALVEEGVAVQPLPAFPDDLN